MSKTKTSADDETYGDAQYKKNEKVLLFHGPLIYEGKVLSVQRTEKKKESAGGPYEYLIHYAGWSKKWDEVVPESRVLRHNEENLQLQKEMKKQHDDSGGAAKKRAKGAMSGKGAPAIKRAAIAFENDASNTSDVLAPQVNIIAVSEGEAASFETAKDKVVIVEMTSDVNEDTEDESEAKMINSDKTATSNESTTEPRRGELPDADEDQSMEDLEADKEVASIEWKNETETAPVQQSELDIQNFRFPTPQLHSGPVDEGEFELLVPAPITTILVEDYKRIAVLKMLLKIPARMSADLVLDDFCGQVKNELKKKQFNSIADGVREDFDKQVRSGSMDLFYESEKPQATLLLSHVVDEADKDEVVPTNFACVYGVMHLLRFCSRFGTYYNKGHTHGVTDVELLKAFLVDLYAFVESKNEDYFSAENDYMPW